MSGKEYTAKSVEEALEKALNEMMLTRDDIDYEIITQPSKGFLGFGQKDAVVSVKRKLVEEIKEIVENLESIQENEPEEDPTACVCDIEETEDAVPSNEVEEKMAEVEEKVEIPSKNRTEEAAEKGKEFLAKTFEEMGLQVEIITKEKNGNGNEIKEKRSRGIPH